MIGPLRVNPRHEDLVERGLADLLLKPNLGGYGGGGVDRKGTSSGTYRAEGQPLQGAEGESRP